MPDQPVPLVVVGASAGGVEALRTFVAGLPHDLPACVLVVLHVPASATSVLPSILDRSGPLPARHAREGDALTAGQVLVAPPDHHLIVVDGHVTLSRGPWENGHRPAVDVLFRSAARAAGERVVAIVLSGSLDDGAAGMVAVAQRGGTRIVQQFDDALYDGMPRSAAAADHVEHVLPVAQMPALLTEVLAALPPAPEAPPTELMNAEAEMADLDPDTMHDPDRPGTPSGFGCPDCNGALFEIEDGGMLRFRCRVGHAWSPDSLIARQSTALESALWMALRGLEEKVAMNTTLAGRADQRGDHRTAERFRAAADESRGAAELVRALVASIGGTAAEPQR
ncbi:chemotaxis protein CheB [Nocardioides abyssi]|uniref:protein-glutamate methylesterase n=1 Tax=Nocardioides abyssi TaxID=3058370 RepID=A0ABT8EXG4_9ACTN|nr:chemotaxis protein CheB [Nocardioides abyssi]MDN4162892.1 chemotaxis protein CheB [Nocardioides abyssi]